MRLMGRLGLCGCLMVLCLAVRADYTPFVVSTLPYRGVQGTDVFVDTVFASLSGYPYVIAVEFTLDIPDQIPTPAVGAVVDSLQVPFFETIHGDPSIVYDSHFLIVGDSASAPDFSQTFATFEVPTPPATWPANGGEAYPHTSLSTVDAATSGTFIDGDTYWLVMESTVGFGLDFVTASWYRSDTHADPFVLGSILFPLADGVGNSPAYRLDFTPIGEPVPEPTAASLLALAGAASLLGRRRRAA